MSMLKPIIFYDVSSIVQGKSWFVGTIQTRYCLTFKRLPFQTVWLEYTEIKPFYEQHSLAPFATRNVNGTPITIHTLPVIMDPNTNRWIKDTFEIAQYLDEQYPDTPKLMPHNTAALIHVFHTAFYQAIKNTILLACFKSAQKLKPESKGYYIRTRVERFDIPWMHFASIKIRVAQWNALRTGYNIIDGWYAMSRGQFLLGDTPCFADFIVAALCKWAQYCCEDLEWEEMKNWNRGRWGRLMEAIDRYSDCSSSVEHNALDLPT
ncbi:uncharacterized protein EDB93DRAFT_1250605 [Suillus bovinus]|uniref:uncharacterized protein n=1 Tax=Suillus bovinus TaxID=48563 RepID=UPI001B8858FA|nr:uncharacterized protein EDB93DRAFT_1250605 [Suillus bovinus]KAG2147461.1 hypothetical protein EDB93DRAFT_1250605 [Suillus bovinus]